MISVLHIGPESDKYNMFPILGGLSSIGIKVHTCDLSGLCIKDALDAINCDLINIRPSFVLTIGGWFDRFEYKDVYSYIKMKGIPHVYWAIEDSTFLQWSSLVAVEYYDFIFTISEECVSKYKQLGKKVSYMPFFCDIKIHRKRSYIEKFANDIAVLSNNYCIKADPSKTEFRRKCYKDLIKPLVDGRYDIKIYGHNWQTPDYGISKEYIGGYVDRDCVFSIYSSAKIIINIQWNYSGHITYKTFESMGCRAFVLAPYTQVQDKYFKHKKHLVYSHNEKETIALVNYYLKNEKERRDIALNGQVEVYKNHNSNKRAIEFVKILRENKIL